MAFIASVLKVMIASPGDVEEERRIAREVLHEWNCIHAQAKGLVVLPIGWETHSTPEMGDRPQAIVNMQILAHSDLLVAIFGTRMGSPTGKAASGTAEEIETHLSAGKHAMLYFSSAPVPPDSRDEQQYAALKEFKAGCLTRGLVESYESVDEFREKFFRQFSQTMNRIKFMSPDFDPEADGQVQLQPDTPSLSDAATTLLLEAAADSIGTLLRTDYSEGIQLHVNNKQLIDKQDGRTLARWDGAIKELELRGLIQDMMYLDTLVSEYKVTNEGFRVADALREAEGPQMPSTQ